MLWRRVRSHLVEGMLEEIIRRPGMLRSNRHQGANPMEETRLLVITSPTGDDQAQWRIIVGRCRAESSGFFTAEPDSLRPADNMDDYRLVQKQIYHCESNARGRTSRRFTGQVRTNCNGRTLDGNSSLPASLLPSLKSYCATRSCRTRARPRSYKRTLRSLAGCERMMTGDPCLLARDRMEWTRKLQRKSLTSGAIDADSAPGPSGAGNGVGQSKGKGQVQVKEKGVASGKRLAIRLRRPSQRGFVTWTYEMENVAMLIASTLTFRRTK